MQAKYPTRAAKYCTDTWLIWKENLVTAYINQNFHFGVTVTSPIEGCHSDSNEVRSLRSLARFLIQGCVL